MNSPAGKRDIQISKALSYLLRHGALKEGLPIDNNGFIPVSVLLRHNRLKSHKCTLEDIHRIVENNDKKRFQIMNKDLEDGGLQEVICATQGHSIATITPDNEVLEKVTAPTELPEKLIHGTSISKLLLILQSGSIKKLRRNHIHLSPGISGRDSQVVSGMRTSSNAYIHLVLGQTLLDKIQLFRSLNNVYLTPDDVDLSLFKSVTIRPSKRASDDINAVVVDLNRLGIPYELSGGQ